MEAPQTWRFGLEELLSKIEEFETASLGLIAWEYMTTEAEIQDVWDVAAAERLLTFVNLDQHTGEAMWTLSEAGHQRLAGLRSRSLPR